MLDQRSEFLPSWMKNFAYQERYKVVDFQSDENYRILQIDNNLDGRLTCREIHKKKLIDRLVNHLSKYASEEYLMDQAQATRAVNVWLARTDKMNKMPKIVAFKSDPGLALCRLPFDPVKSFSSWESASPMFAEIMSRMTNSQAFMMRIGSIFDENADRKQTVWISGQKDSGKSQIDKIIRYICGYDPERGSMGGYVSLGAKDLNSAHWKQVLVDKRVVSVLEAKPEFLNQDDFKSITGDDVHTINPKGTAMFQARIECLMFFYSNDKPLIDSKDEIIERVIHCHISPVKAENMIPGHLVFQMLKNELPFFLGACIDMYQATCKNGERIPNSKDTLIEASDEHEQWALDLFERHFVVAQNNQISAGDVRAMLMTQYRMSDNRIANLKRIWEKYHEIGYIRNSGGRYWTGLNWKSTGNY